MMIILLTLNELLLVAAKETLTTGPVFVRFAHLPEETAGLADIRDNLQTSYQYALIFLPVIMMLKFVFLSLVLQTGFAVQFKELSFSIALRVIMAASISQLLAGLARYIVVVSENPGRGSGRIQETIPFGVGAMIKIEKLNPELLFLVNQFNIFELLWCLLIYLGLSYYRTDEPQQLRLMVPLFWLTLVFFQFFFVLVSHQLLGP
jgi:hypothetical protein